MHQIIVLEQKAIKLESRQHVMVARIKQFAQLVRRNCGNYLKVFIIFAILRSKRSRTRNRAGKGAIE